MAESYNGWPASPDKDEIDVVQSEWFPGGVKAGDVTTVFRYVVEQFNARVEPVVGGWCWGYSYRANVNNPSSLSCHASGTALDINAPEHPNGSRGTFTDAQRGEIYAILDEVQGAVHWLDGVDGGTADEMHFEIQVDADTLARIAQQLPTGPKPPPDQPPPTGAITMFVVISEVACIAMVNNVMFQYADWNTYVASYNASGQGAKDNQLVIGTEESLEARHHFHGELFKQHVQAVS